MSCLKFVLFCVFMFGLGVKSVESAALIDEHIDMASVDYASVDIKEQALFTPPLDEVVDGEKKIIKSQYRAPVTVTSGLTSFSKIYGPITNYAWTPLLSRGLPATFKHVDVAVEDSPDLTQPPFHLTAPGLLGDAKLIELGGPPYLVPLVQRDKVYDLEALLKHLGRQPALLAGAGAGPWPYIGVNCEGIINLFLDKSVISQGTRIVSVSPVGAVKGNSGYLQQTLPNNETRTALLGNYLLSEGKPGKVIKIVAKERIGESNFITAIRETLKKHYGDKVIGLGGAFLLKEGKVKHHVMPDFSSSALCSDSDVNDWLHFFEMKAPIVHLGTMVTGDLNLDLRVQHFHGYSAHGDGGHYHYDTTPGEVHYVGYFTLASSVIRIDPPKETHGLGRD